jgi:hypothetical protein
MWRFTKKFLFARLSELIILVPLVPFMLFLNSQSIDVNLSVPPPQDPKITTIIVYPKLRAIGIVGETVYNRQVVWLEDQQVGEAVEITTDTNGHFVAALDSASAFVRPGAHQVVALVEIEQDKVFLVESNVLVYSIDDQFKVTLDPASRGDISLQISDITEEEFKALQATYQLRTLSADERQLLAYREMGLRAILFWFTVFQLIIYIILLVVIPYFILLRWRRKKAQHQSFWSIGKGIYFQPPEAE